MNIRIQNEGPDTRIEFSGKLDGSLASQQREQLFASADLFRFCRLMIRFRQQHPWPAGAMGDLLELSWHGTRSWHPDWSASSRVLAFMRRGNEHGDLIYAVMNMYWEPLAFELPSLPEGRHWLVFANTGMPTPEEIWESGKEPVLSDQKKILAAGRSIIVLLTKSKIGDA
jgi:glycogen operon protein